MKTTNEKEGSRPSSTARAKMVEQVLTRPANKFTTSTLVEADLQKIRKKLLTSVAGK
jgi:hypothetical protein